MPAPRARKDSGSAHLRQIAGGLPRFPALDALVDLLAMDRDVLRRRDPDPHLVPLDAEHGDRDRIADHQRLSDATGENQHLNFSMSGFVPAATGSVNAQAY